MGDGIADLRIAPSSVDAAALMAKGRMLADLDGSSEMSLREALVSLASMFGIPVAARRGDPLVATLQPTESKHARRRSLSGTFSLGAFPCHVDTAHWVVPCRYVLLACLDPGIGNRETVLLDTRSLPLTDQQRELLYCSPLRIMNGSQSFFSTILHRRRAFVRYDPGCMRPVSSEGQLALNIFDSSTWPALTTRIRWRRGRVLVIDNWRVLHGRGEAACEDGQRTLMRVYVNGESE